jgi:crotonobetainyl-CoA:carnitine CoA-transferase CaiB-like acyl-CoA transferase
LVAVEQGPRSGEASRSGGTLTASGLRVLDFTRVIAGPVATRMLAALGADVVRVEWPDRPELPLAALDGGLGKRWLRLDLRDPVDRERMENELSQADAVVSGHRPGALDAFGLHPDALAERHPHLVCATLSAWGDRGPWGRRRGFDSLVQAATGIAHALRADDRPGALPVQALDHATGYLMAAATLRNLATRARTGEAKRARLCLAATAHLLLAEGTRTPPEARDVDPAPHLVELDHPDGRLTVAAPPGELDGRPLSWPCNSF